MAPLPTVDQFPTFADTYWWLKKGNCQCIWHLPDKKRCCYLPITEESNKDALHRVEKTFQKNYSPETKIQILADIAEICCCVNHHRNKIWGTGLKDKLAVRWNKEISEATTKYLRESSHSSKLKREPVTSPVFTTSSKDNKIIGQSHLKTSPLNQTGLKSSTVKQVIFARHEAWKGESLSSKLMEPIDAKAAKNGSVYLYTHTEEAFSGFIKIGFTSRRTESRLYEWAECGHGNPSLLKSYDDIRHPNRVEELSHVELAKCRYEIRWCKVHQRSHVEWFKIAFEVASAIVYRWSQWIARANPYDRRGILKSFWKDTIIFLIEYDIPITAELMMQIQSIEEDSSKLPDFIKDDTFWERKKSIVKEEPSD